MEVHLLDGVIKFERVHELIDQADLGNDPCPGPAHVGLGLVGARDHSHQPVVIRVGDVLGRRFDGSDLSARSVEVALGDLGHAERVVAGFRCRIKPRGRVTVHQVEVLAEVALVQHPPETERLLELIGNRDHEVLGQLQVFQVELRPGVADSVRFLVGVRVIPQ